MRKHYQRLVIICFCLVVSGGVTSAEDIYVTGVTKITMRTGPGTEHKIVAMLKSGTKLEIVEYQNDWTQVRTDQGKIGWVLSRFLTQRVPDALLVEKLEKDNQELMAKLKAVEEENQTLTVKNATLVQIEEKYKELKQKSSDFLKLDARFKEMTLQYDAQKAQIRTLENDLNNEPKLWFLIGPGVFIVGLFFGLSRRKKRSSSLL
jgi:SH3 domain protein